MEIDGITCGGDHAVVLKSDIHEGDAGVTTTKIVNGETIDILDLLEEESLTISDAIDLVARSAGISRDEAMVSLRNAIANNQVVACRVMANGEVEFAGADDVVSIN